MQALRFNFFVLGFLFFSFGSSAVLANPNSYSLKIGEKEYPIQVGQKIQIDLGEGQKQEVELRPHFGKFGIHFDYPIGFKLRSESMPKVDAIYIESPHSLYQIIQVYNLKASAQKIFKKHLEKLKEEYKSRDFKVNISKKLPPLSFNNLAIQSLGHQIQFQLEDHTVEVRFYVMWQKNKKPVAWMIQFDPQQEDYAKRHFEFIQSSFGYK